MRHGKKFNHLSRKVGHRRSLLRNLSISLITHKRLSTTLAKAKALRKYVEPIITTSKSNTQHAHREAFRYLQNKEAVKELFTVVAPKVGDRPGGYVRVIRTGTRMGDNAETALIELVDFNETYNVSEKSAGKTTRRRRRRGGSSNKSADTTTVSNSDTATEAVVADGAVASAPAPVVADVTTDTPTGEVIAEGLVEEATAAPVSDETVAESSPEAANEVPEQDNDSEKPA